MSKSKVVEPVRDRMPAFSDWFSDRFTDRWFGDLWNAFGEQAMKVEEYREDGAVVVRAELPGIDPEKDVEVTVTDGVLRIHAERSQRTKKEDASHYRSEFSYGAFTRAFRLPAGASEDDVKATYKDGILEVRVPVDQGKAATQRVPVTAL
jgi:HSP20 family protein